MRNDREHEDKADVCLHAGLHVEAIWLQTRGRIFYRNETNKEKTRKTVKNLVLFLQTFQVNVFKKILNSCPTQGRVEGWDAMKPLQYRSVSSKGAGRPRLKHHHKGGWNETKWMRWGWRNGEVKLVVGENERNPVKNLPTPRFVHHETHMEGPRRVNVLNLIGNSR